MKATTKVTATLQTLKSSSAADAVLAQQPCGGSGLKWADEGRGRARVLVKICSSVALGGPNDTGLEQVIHGSQRGMLRVGPTCGRCSSELGERWTAEMLLNHPFLAGEDDRVLVHDEKLVSLPLSKSPRSNMNFLASWVPPPPALQA
ncbi:hypothetical protein PIB30_086782 [Stylosanthes scabra]|uniref:Uncharacterized protein n=1 Tax=Stylosanthes scabra TaxID=79078 RepID=A0ABU6YQX8_9FABA|nr:hypothetical protein [Stylosanthes scabra]